MGVFFFLLFALRVAAVEALVDVPLLVRTGPEVVVGLFSGEEVAGYDAVHGCVLHVDV